ncbi:hypothetical protein JOB18_043359 [Solea senegalensis]|uniref:Uncharacterized protein n=1 Tax=Solea senegalensis TaxID=28829 RepID=A0AAV6RL90_SOLSE|nr:hypothetical protein JOB18_043359 [Solea senegalensis]
MELTYSSLWEHVQVSLQLQGGRKKERKKEREDDREDDRRMEADKNPNPIKITKPLMSESYIGLPVTWSPMVVEKNVCVHQHMLSELGWDRGKAYFEVPLNGIYPVPPAIYHESLSRIRVDLNWYSDKEVFGECQLHLG